MNDKFLLNLLLQARAVYKYRWRGLIAAWCVALAGAAIVLEIPKKYEASVRIYANADSILKPLLAGITVQPDNNQRVAMLSRVVISRPNVQHLIEATGLDENAKSADAREKLIDETIKLLELQRSGDINSNIYIVKFRDTQPARAMKVVEMLVSMFVETNSGGRQSDTAAAKEFLDQQASLYEKKLQDAESRVKEFKLKNNIGMSPDDKDYLSQMSVVSEQLRNAQLQLREAENSRDAYQRGLASEAVPSNAAPQAAEGESVAEIDARIDTMKRNLDSLLQRYTEDHPDVVGARRVIKDLEDQRRRTASEYRRSGGANTYSGAGGGIRASEQLKVSLAQAEANVASMRARVNEYSARYHQLQSMAKHMPELEAELAQLNRDYEVNQKNYTSLIARRESANISGEMQSVAGVGDFRIVDPPRVSPTAVSPNRPALLIGSLALAIAVGFAVMFLSNELRPRIFDRSQLREATGLPVLGGISIVENEQSIAATKQENRRFLLSGAGMLLVYVLFVVAMVFITAVSA